MQPYPFAHWHRGVPGKKPLSFAVLAVENKRIGLVAPLHAARNIRFGAPIKEQGGHTPDRSCCATRNGPGIAISLRGCRRRRSRGSRGSRRGRGVACSIRVRSQESSNQNRHHQASGYKPARIYKPSFLIEIELCGVDPDSLTPSLPCFHAFRSDSHGRKAPSLAENGRLAPLVDTELHSTCQTEID